jgi:tripartite-type tricarboxylate transporter receptor subunit TctC
MTTTPAGGSPGRRSILAAAATGLVGLAAPRIGAAQAPTWTPTQPVRIVIGFVPGGMTDASARVLAPHFTQWLGHPVVVDNRGGAGGNIGTEQVVRAAPDGHTLLLAHAGQIVVNPHTFPSIRFDTLRDLAPIGLMRSGVFALVVHPSLGVNSVQELVALLKRNPGKYNYATTAPGGQAHVITEIFKQRTGVDIEGVHFRGSGQATTEVLTGRVPITIEVVPVMLQHMQSGGVKPLMVAADARSSVIPDVPTAAEAGLPDFTFLNWFALFAPRGTPQAIIDRYAELTRRALALPDVAERIRAEGDEPGDGSPQRLAELVAREHRIFGEVVRAQNIRAE